MRRSPASELCRSQSTLWTPAASAPPWMRAFSQLKWLALMLLHPRESRSVPTTTRRRRRPRPPLPRRRTQRRRKRQNRNQRSFHPLVLKNTPPWANRRPPRRRKRPTRRLPTPCQRRKRRMTRWRKQIALRDPLAHIKVFFERFFYCLHWCLVSHTRYISILSFLLLSVKTTLLFNVIIFCSFVNAWLFAPSLYNCFFLYSHLRRAFLLRIMNFTLFDRIHGRQSSIWMLKG